MSDPKLAKAAQHLFKQVQRIARRLTKATVLWLLRAALLVYRRGRYANAGFVLPTTAMLVLVVTLTAASLGFRAVSTSTRAIGDLQNRVIYNAATPAIDRARAKIEFMFDPAKDFRFPGGVPSESFLTSMMLNDGSTVNGATASPLRIGGTDPYTLSGEQRIDINGDNRPDNAWVYREDTDRDGKPDATIVYSVIYNTPNDAGTGNSRVPGFQRLLQLNDEEKLAGEDQGRQVSFTRSGPLTNAKAKSCGSGGNAGAGVEQGWYEDLGGISTTLRKNFQVDAFVIPDAVASGAQGNFTTLEFQQDRQLDRGNKWGAWFRNDMEIFPGPQFNWNGAIHTEGSFVATGRFAAYLVSTRPSCVYSPARSSELSVTRIEDTVDNSFYGLFSAGSIRDGNTNATDVVIHLYSDNPQDVANNTGGNFRINLNNANHWFNGSNPLNIALDPVAVQTEAGNDSYRARAGTPPTNAAARNMANMGANNRFRNRFFANKERAPYVDDTYRADDRYGPKTEYKGITIPTGLASGDKITPANAGDNFAALASSNAIGNDDTNVGLDGYWERRARNEGLRILVGQRLELGNSNGWSPPKDRPNSAAGGAPLQDPIATTITPGDGNFNTLRRSDGSTLAPAGADIRLADADLSDSDGDPLYQPYELPATNPMETRQRRALRDNIAAVQATAVYHHASGAGLDYPVACLATTAHHGSPTSLQRSINFIPTIFKDGTTSTDIALITDFFNGRGTNGWEFAPPGGDANTFAATVANPTSPLRIALDNLAHFAGDPQGAFPATQEAGRIHPDPEQTMWGNFSELRRTLQDLDASGYANLSPADKTYLQTAACTVGMLAYNIEQAQKFDPTNAGNDGPAPGIPRLMQRLGQELWQLMDGVDDPASGNYEVLPKQQLATYNYGDRTTPNDQWYSARDYDRVPAEAFLGRLREKWVAQGNSANDPIIRLAELVFTHFQIQRDRTYGFRPSPAANTWNYNPYVVPTNAGLQPFSAACDPNLFRFATLPGGNEVGFRSILNDGLFNTLTGSGAAAHRFRLGLSRLCGTLTPPGALREGPGDPHMPAHNDTANQGFLPLKDDSTIDFRETALILRENAEPSDTPSSTQIDSVTAYDAPTRGAAKYFWQYRQYFDRKNVGPTTPNGNRLNSAPYNSPYYLRATVAPKWPSLYYLFPQLEHDRDGAVFAATDDAGNAVCIDHRQPNGALTELTTTCTEGGAPMVAAFQPWAEPYVTDDEVRAAIGTYRFRPVDGGAATLVDFEGRGTTYDAAYPTISITTFLFNEDGTPAVPDRRTDQYEFNYKTFLFPLQNRSLAGVALQPRRLPTGFSNPGPLNALDPMQLPIFPLASIPNRRQYQPSNRIIVPQGSSAQTTAVIPFLDRVLFNGREWMPARVLDLDIGMLRRTAVTQGKPWLPVSGIIYAFREDAVREDAIARPPAGTRTNANATTPAAQSDPPYTAQKISLKPVDYVPDPERRVHGFRLRDATILKRSPATGIDDQDNIRGMSFFSDDPVYIMGYYNLHQTAASDDEADNNPYIEDNNTANRPGTAPVNPGGTPPAAGIATRLEEFTQKLPTDRVYNEAEFYTGRTTLDTRFANVEQDWWRPSEILADSITILSETFCDGSAIDTFMTTGVNTDNDLRLQDTTFSGRQRTASGETLSSELLPYSRKTGSSVDGAAIYNEPRTGLYGVGCVSGANANAKTSFLNQNRPRYSDILGKATDVSTRAADTVWSWVHENPWDVLSPVALSRNGSGRVVPSPQDPGASVYDDRRGFISKAALDTGNPASIQDSVDRALQVMVWRDNKLAVDYDFKAQRVDSQTVNNTYYRIQANPGGAANDVQRWPQRAENTRVNSIIISGIGPSRSGSPYGGLHNFPRFLERWNYLWFSGSFLQLSFSNYGTAPFDNDAWELAETPQTGAGNNERISYYAPPQRLWGYDVALQLAPAGPAAARFVTASNIRNEFYNEPPANDAYISGLCRALQNNPAALGALDYTEAETARNRLQNPAQFRCPG